MSVAIAEEPRVLHTLPGRLRVHVPGWSGQGRRTLLGAVAGSTTVLLATLLVSPLRDFLNLVTPGVLGWALMGAGALVAVVLNRLLTALSSVRPTRAPPPTSPIASPAFVRSP